MTIRTAVPILMLFVLPILILPSCAGGDRNAALNEAVNAQDAEILAELLSDTGSLEGRDSKGRTALHHAVLAGDIPAAAILLNAGADSNSADRSGRTPLHYAVLDCHTDMMAMLLAAGADPLIPDDDDESPLSLADKSDCKDAGPVIRSSMADFTVAQ